jgi:membrane-associated phospholipid phosphatase
MEDMQFLREYKRFFYVAMILPVFFFYLDKAVILWMRNFHKDRNIYPLFHSVDPFINFIAHGATLLILAFLIYLFGRSLNQKVCEAGRTLFIGLIASGIVVQIIKHLIGRARPRLTVDFAVIGPSLKSGYDSLPSGHTALAFTLAYVLSSYLPGYRTLFYLFAIFIGFERIEDSAHFPSDVLAGAILGLLIGRFVLFRSGKIEIKDHAVKQ